MRDGSGSCERWDRLNRDRSCATVTVENVTVSTKSGQTSSLPVFFLVLVDDGCVRNLLQALYKCSVQSLLYRLDCGECLIDILTNFFKLYPRFQHSCAPVTSKPGFTLL